MLFSNLKRATALTVTTVLLAGTAAVAAPRAHVRPNAVSPDTTPAGAEQVLNEGGTLASLYFGNIMDILGKPIPGTAPFYRDNQGEFGTIGKTTLAVQYDYAATGTGGAQLDFVHQSSGFKQAAASIPPVVNDGTENYSNAAPFGFTSPWAGTAASTVTSDDLHWAAGDAPIPLGPVVPGFGTGTYADSLSTFNNTNETGNGGGYNSSRGPAIVVPVIGTGVSIILNSTNLTIPASGVQLTQNDLCGIFTGNITDWNGTSTPLTTTSQPITIVHRSDGSGTTFLFAYDMSNMCSSKNPYTGTGAVQPGNYWGATAGGTTGVGTDSMMYASGSTAIPQDVSAPEVVWPSTSKGFKGSNALLAGVGNTVGGIGYISPSFVSQLQNGVEAYVENYTGAFEQANYTTVSTALGSPSSPAGAAPTGYPIPTTTSILYYPFPTAASGDALVGFSYGYFYTCNNARVKDQVTAYETIFKDTLTAAAKAKYDTIAADWQLNPLSDTLKAASLKSIELSKAEAAGKSASGTYTNPATGATGQKYTCTPV